MGVVRWRQGEEMPSLAGSCITCTTFLSSPFDSQMGWDGKGIHGSSQANELELLFHSWICVDGLDSSCLVGAGDALFHHLPLQLSRQLPAFDCLLLFQWQ